MTWLVRPAEREDSDAIWRLVTQLAEFERLSDQLQGSSRHVEKWLFDEPISMAWVAESEGEVVGYALCFPVLATFRMTPGLWLEDLYVDPRRRGAGIGKALIGAVIQYARERSYARVDWAVLDWNEGAIGFYESLGAEVLPDWRICRYNL